MRNAGILAVVQSLTIGAVVSAVLGTGLLTGGGYLLLQRPEELQQLRALQIEIDEVELELERALAIDRVFESGWFGFGSPGELSGEWELGQKLLMLSIEAQLSPDSIEQEGAEQHAWRDLAMQRLCDERDRIAGVSPASSALQARRQDMLSAYNAEIDTVNYLNWTAAMWSSLTKTQREQVVESAPDREVTPEDTRRRALLQVDAAEAVRLSRLQLTRRKDEIGVARRQLVTKTVLGSIGLLSGSALLVGCAVWGRGRTSAST